MSEITSRVTSTSGTSSRIAPAVPEIENEDFVVVGVVAGASAPIQQLVHRHLRRSAARRNHRLQVIHVARGAGRGVSASPGPENPSLRRNAILRQATLASVHPTGCNGRNETRTLASSLSEAEESEEFSGTERVGVGGGKGRGKTRRERREKTTISATNTVADSDESRIWPWHRRSPPFDAEASERGQKRRSALHYGVGA